MRLIGPPANRARNAASSSAASSASGGAARSSRCAQLRFGADAREFVPWADRETIVAAVDAIADQRPQLARDRPLVLDRQIGNAAPRVDLVGRGKGGGRAGVETGAAAPAMVGLRLVGRQVEIGEDRAEKQPRAEIAADQIGVLALPAEARRRGERLLHHRRRIDEHLDLGPSRARRRDEPGGERLQPALDDVMIVAVARIDRDRGAVAGRERNAADRHWGRSSAPA